MIAYPEGRLSNVCSALTLLLMIGGCGNEAVSRRAAPLGKPSHSIPALSELAYIGLAVCFVALTLSPRARSRRGLRRPIVNDCIARCRQRPKLVPPSDLCFLEGEVRGSVTSNLRPSGPEIERLEQVLGLSPD